MSDVLNDATMFFSHWTQGQWVMAGLAAVIAVIALMTFGMARKRRGGPARGASASSGSNAYGTTAETVSGDDVPPLLSEPELACFNMLHEVAGKEYHVMAKVSLSDIAIVKRGVDRQLLDRVAREHHHVDFVLCAKDSMAVSCAVDIQEAGAADDLGPADLLERVGVPVFRLPRKTSYSLKEIRDLLTPFLKEKPPTPDEMVATISMEAFRTCGKCRTRMVLKRAKSGKYKGTLFWVCGRYPECRGIELFTR